MKISNRIWKGMFTAAGLLAALYCIPAAEAVDTKDTRMLSGPAVSATHVAFVYAEDLWVCGIDGSGVRRLTTHQGIERNPRFSPDGRTLAFSAQYDGNTDVYAVPVEGGVPRRLTWHPGADIVQDFSRDGRSVLFTSARAVFTNRYLQLFEVPLAGGHPEALPIPNAYKACYSPDGKRIAYTPIREAFNQWKNYRGGTASRIWLYDRADHSVEQIPQPKGRCNDTDPMWINDRVYFRSDRNGEFNLFSFDPAGMAIVQVTRHEDFPIVNCSAGPGRIVYEQSGYLHIHDLDQNAGRRLRIGVAADLIETRPRYVSGNQYIRSGDLSPSGTRAVFGFRGDIITVPAKKGDPRNLTRTIGVHEHTPAWSPDGKWIAFFSDASGEYELRVASQDGKGETRLLALDGAGFYDSLRWSPDSRKLSYSDNSWTLYWLEMETGDTQKISTEPIYGPLKVQFHSWSPDSLWIAYTRTTPTYFQQVHLYSLEEKKSYPITDGLSDVGAPVFDKSGKYLYMAASTDAGPVRQWFAMSNADMDMSNALYLAVLQKGEISPLKRESDEEKGEDEKAKKDTGEAESTKEEEDKKEEKKDEVLKIDFENIHERIIAIPTGTSLYSSLQPGPEGQLYYLKSEGGSGQGGPFGGGGGNLYRYDLKERKEEKLASSLSGFTLTNDGKKILLRTSSGDYSIAAAKPGIKTAEGKLATNRIQVRIDPRTEWEQIYHEAWRINRDYFYDPNMHGADWPALRRKYQVFLPHLAVRSDLNRLIQWLCSELAVGHHNVFGGDRLNEVDTVPGGLLGADYEAHEGRYRFKKIYGGLNWNTNLRSPLTEPGVDVKEGEYLLAVEGVDLKAPENLYSHFENTNGKTVEITVGPDPGGEDSRTVKVEPVSNEYSLRNRDWVEGNIKKVDEATDGRVAYVYVPNTSTMGHVYFKRYFFPQAHKEAIIVDERFNGGGQVADYYIDLLRRPVLCYWATRYGMDFKTPLSSIQGPKVMLINESAGSGGDLLPWMFRQLKLGKLIGRPTWGGLVGMLGFPPLMDGGFVTAPNLAIWTEDGFIVENVGVPPDIEVEHYPKDIIAGRDPQLEKAIEVILEQLADDPPKTPKRPPFPIRVRR